jgi:hypothetical protein
MPHEIGPYIPGLNFADFCLHQHGDCNPKFTTSRADFGLLDVKPAFAIKHLRAITGLILKTSVVSRDDAILLAIR